MTLRLSFLFFTLFSFVTGGFAQTYYPITASNGQWQVFGTNSVQANRFGFGPCQGKYLAAPGFCGVSPYYIGDCGRNGWRYAFPSGATNIRIRMTSLHDDDTVRIAIPGMPSTTVVLTAGNLSNSWASACSPSIFAAVTTNQGYVTASGAPTGFSDVEITFKNTKPPYYFNNLQVEHMRSFGNTTSDGVVYGIEFANDTCTMHFEATVDSPQCSGKPIKFHATDHPNTTHYWRAVSNPWTGSGANPVIPNANLVTHNGLYIDSAIRGACKYIDTVKVSIDLSPIITTAGQKGPRCPGENDTLFVTSTQATYEWFGPNSFFSSQADPALNNIQKSDEGTYYVFAKSTNGCFSDTVGVNVKVNDPAIASFDYKVGLGCDADSVAFYNISVNGANPKWDFGDGNTSTLNNPLHYYVSPTMPVVYTVKLSVGNGTCSDDTIVNIVFDHPLKAAFTVDDDSICQGTTINVKNNSVFTPATLPVFDWDMKDGTKYNFFDISHQYTVSGEYLLTLIVTDFLGCKDTATHVIVVDSLGSINFGQTDKSLCLGNTIIFDGYFSPWGVNKTIWNLGDGTIKENIARVPHAYTQPGTYTVTFSADYRICPPTVFTQQIVIRSHPVINLGPDRTICPGGNPLQLKDAINEGNPNAKWKWNTEVINNTPSMMVYTPGTYAATVEIDGCESTDSVAIEKSCYIDIPNAFTPNGDGIDDYFLPKELLSRGLTQLNMAIFNRWGQPVFKTNSLEGRGWDGKFNNEPQPLGVYVYLIEATFLNGASEKYQGNITLLR